MRYGIPDFKMEKHLIDRRMAQMSAEGVVFRPNAHVGVDVPAAQLLADFDAVVLTGGAEAPRDLDVPGRDLSGIVFAMDFLPQQNKVVAGDTVADQITAAGKHVVIIGGGDTGSDCVGTSNRHGAASITQFELLPPPPAAENKPLVWPNWPIKLRTSTSHEEGCERDWAVTTKRFEGRNGRVGSSLPHVSNGGRTARGLRRWSKSRAANSKSRRTSCCSRWGSSVPRRPASGGTGRCTRRAFNVKADTESYRTSSQGLAAATSAADNRSSSGRSGRPPPARGR
jgi:NADPH-dependent glutamate synthase beta subunit-like oxidoreductase